MTTITSELTTAQLTRKILLEMNRLDKGKARLDSMREELLEREGVGFKDGNIQIVETNRLVNDARLLKDVTKLGLLATCSKTTLDTAKVKAAVLIEPKLKLRYKPSVSFRRVK